MRIDCPNCGAAYDLPPERVPPGRGVRCARCAVTWIPVAAFDVGLPAPVPELVAAPAAAVVMEAPPHRPEPEPVAEPEPPPPHAEPEPPHPVEVPGPQPVAEPHAPPIGMVPEPLAVQSRPLRTPPPFVGWIVTAVILAAVGALLVLRRDAVMAAWPASERAYALLGFAH